MFVCASHWDYVQYTVKKQRLHLLDKQIPYPANYYDSARPPAHAQPPHPLVTPIDPAEHYSPRKDKEEDREEDLEKETDGRTRSTSRVGASGR